MRLALALASGWTCLTWGALALAQTPPPAAPPPAAVAGSATAAAPNPKNLGNPLTLAISAERLMGVSRESAKAEVSEYGYTSSATIKQTHVALLGMAPSAGLNEGLPPFGLSPRLGFDFFPVRGFSLGAAATVGFSSGEAEVEYGGYSASDDTPKVTSFELNPRLGYAAAFNDIVAIWPRVGLTYMSSTSKYDDTYYGYTVKSKTTISATALTLEALLALSPVDHFAILVGPFADVGLGGKVKDEESGAGYTVDAESDLTITSFGLTLGITGFLP